MFKRTFANCILLAAVTLLSACSAAPPGAGKRFFFPPPPAEPKIEYLQSYFSDRDLKPAERDLLTEYVLGETRPQALFTTPVDVASDGRGRVFVADTGARQVFVLDLAKHKARPLALPAVGAGLERGFAAPIGVSLDAEGKLYVCDVVGKRVDVFSTDERYLFSIEDDGLVLPTAVAIDLPRALIYVVDTAQHRLAKFDLQGRLLGFMGERGAEPGQFNFPTDVDVDGQGQVYVLDALNARVQVFDAAGKFLRMFGERGTAEGSFEIPKNLAVSGEGLVYVTDALAHKVVIFSGEGRLLLRIGGKSVATRGISPGGFYLPRGINVDAEGGLWVVDSLNRMVHRFQFLTPGYLAGHPIDPEAVQLPGSSTREGQKGHSK